MIYSYSRLESFKQCPRKYAYQYIEKPDVEKQPTIEAHLGTVCHETVQQIYKDLLLSKRMSLEETLAFYDDRWERIKPPNLRIIRDRYTEQNYKDTGRRYVEEFYKTNSPFNDGRTIGIEKQLQININGIQMIGYIDRLVDHGSGQYEIIDYKTNKDLPSPDDLNSNWQLPLYHIGLSEILPDIKDVTCTWYFLAHGKPISLKKQAEHLDQLKKDIQELVVKINETQEFEPKVSALCSWCDFESICPARKHFVEVEKLPVEKFPKEMGVQLVDAYIEAKQKAGENESLVKELEQKIFEYARQHNYMNIRGSQDKLRVWSKRGALKVVTKEDNPKANESITAILKKHNLWDRFSFLSGFGLAKAIESSELPPAVVKELAPYLKKEDVWRLYPSKYKEL